VRRIVLSLFAFLLLGSRAFAADNFFVDGTGQKVPYGLNARRIVSLAPSATEMLFYLGLGERTVGRSSYCNYPPEAEELPAVGGFIDTSLEKIVALRPDLVVAYQGNNLELVGQLRQLRIQVVAFPEATSLPEIGNQMQQLAWIVLSSGAPHDGNVLEQASAGRVGNWRKHLKSVPVSAAGHPTVFYGMPGEVTYSAAPGSFIDDLITRAGGHNVVPTGKDRWPQVSAEFLLAAQPDWLLISTPCTGHTELTKASRDIRASLARDPVWSKLNAVKHGHIVVINADVLLRPGPRILEALEQLQTALRPGQ
jgi:iron complex transport system substrate-binding protein